MFDVGQMLTTNVYALIQISKLHIWKFDSHVAQNCVQVVDIDFTT